MLSCGKSTRPRKITRFLDDWSGMVQNFARWRPNNPKGIASISPGLARFPEGLPWVSAINRINPERVESPGFAGPREEPLQGSQFFFRLTQGSSFLATLG